MTSVVHRTPGLIPIEAFTITGLSAKPNSTNPIGKFGTGLKYAIAVLVRRDIKVRVFIGPTEYVFFKKQRSFRGKDYDAIRMKKRNSLLSRWTYQELPFTTEYGKYWELWQVFRELHANTLDEGGSTYTDDRDILTNDRPDTTLFVVEDSHYVDVFHERDRIFLPDGASQRSTSEAIQILNRPSSHIYFRGLRIMDLRKEAQYTYNFLEDVDLTEDRTAKHPSLVEARIVGFMRESQDEAFLEKSVANPNQDSYEYGLHHGTAYGTHYDTPRPSESYLRAAQNSTLATAKQVWNEAQPTVASSSQIAIKIPKTLLSDEERIALVTTALNIHPDSEISVNGVPIPKITAEENEEEVMF